jgi:LmbE family N-acetylglucosaminyl deacetylase
MEAEDRALEDDPLADCRRLVLSPHLDDAVLSCGGALAGWAATGDRPVVVTVCAGRPGAELTDFARFQHARWGEEVDLVGRRRAEDERALASLGARPIWLDYLDCIYRGTRYTTEESLFGPLATDEADLIDRLAADLAACWRATAGATVYAPLGLGNHVDHQLVHAAASRLQAAGVPIVWYEDFPYAIRPGGAEQHAALTAGRRPLVVPIGDWLQRKIAAVAAYATQVPVLFGSAAAMPAAVRAYAAAVGGGQPAERFWLT